MTVVTARILVAPDRSISRVAPADLPPREHIALIQREGTPAPAPQLTALPFDVDDPWPEGMSPRREDMYDDNAR